MSTRHELKTWREPFNAVASERKNYEIRKEDNRTFAVGDVLVLRQWNEEKQCYTDMAIEADVTHITRGPAWGIPEGMVVMALANTSDVFSFSRPERKGDTQCPCCGQLTRECSEWCPE